MFLATNRPYELDEAMHRRITAVVEYRSPNAQMRQRIWERLLGIAEKTVETPPKLVLDADVNVATLAVKYELTGGFIKNGT